MPPESPTSRTLEPRVLKALAHPLRYRVLWRLNEVVASPKELAEEFGEPLPKVWYHVVVLHEAGMIELVRETPRRGATEHHYRAVVRPVLRDDEWARLPVGTRQRLSGAVVGEALADLGRAVAAGSLEARSDWHISHMSLALDDEGWRELADLLAGVVERASALQAESTQRQADGSPIPARLTMMLYEGSPTPEPEAS
jgi:DNA-binding transcriptional ArsR family regulator